MLRTVFLALGLLLATPAAVAQQAPTREVLRPSASVAFVKRTLDIPSSGNSSFKADVYAPRGIRPRGAILFVSGTNDVRDWPNYVDLARLAVERGFVGIIPNKRFPRGGGAKALETSHADSVAMLRALGRDKRIGVSADRTCAWLFSGGGLQLAALFDPAAPRIACVIGFYPALGALIDPPSQSWAQTYTPLGAFTRIAATRRMPMLLVRAGRDGEALNRRISEFTTAALAANYPLELVNLTDAQHAFDVVDETDWSRSAIRRAFDFVAKQIER